MRPHLSYWKDEVDMKIYTAEQMKAVDTETITDYGIDGLLLMEHAAMAVRDEVLRAPGGRIGKVLVMCGKGNNGGDGFAVARLLDGRCGGVCAAFFDDPAQLRGDAAKNYALLSSVGVPVICDMEVFAERLAESDVVVDALYGFGFHGALEGRDRQIAEQINASGKYVIAVDMPSGVSADTGVCEYAIYADKTVTFTGYKPAQLLFPAASFCGETVVADIGIPRQITGKGGIAETISRGLVRSALPVRARNAHKGTCGKVLVVGGSRGMGGAVCMSARAALRSGAGLVTVGVPRCLNDIVQQKISEAMTLPLPEDEAGQLSEAAAPELVQFAQGYDTVVFGPGIGRSGAIVTLLREILKLDKHVVIDADGLYALAQDVSMLKEKRAEVVITPHHAEMARLIGTTAAEVEPRAIETAKVFAEKQNVTVVLKGAYTVVAGRVCYVNNSAGNAGMATAGSGDVLSGVVGALLHRVPDAALAAACAVYLHALAGDAAQQRFGMESMTAGDLIASLPEAFRICAEACE